MYTGGKILIFTIHQVQVTFFFEVLKNLQRLRIFVTGYILNIPNI